MTTLTRKTKETDIKCTVSAYDAVSFSESNINTGIGFFDHMLDAFSKHSGFYIELTCKGDLHIDGHHTVEDCGIVLGEIFKKVIFPIKNVERYGNATVVMDEASVSSSVDLSNRPFLVFDLAVMGKVGDFDTELVEEFFRAFVFNTGLTCHIIQNRGKNQHHIIEAAFKALAVSLRRALKQNTMIGIPSTKGVL